MHEERQDVGLQLLNLLSRASAAPFILHCELQGRPAVKAQANSFLQGGGCLRTHHPPPQRGRVQGRRPASHLHLLHWLWRRRCPKRCNDSKLRFLPTQTLRVFFGLGCFKFSKAFSHSPTHGYGLCDFQRRLKFCMCCADGRFAVQFQEHQVELEPEFFPTRIMWVSPAPSNSVGFSGGCSKRIRF